ncbi:hypothetical protein EDC04DRAFT_2498744, partial [Pisolithus marmoratus]
RLHFWDDLVKDYFTLRTVMNTTLWKENKRLNRSACARVVSTASRSRSPLSRNRPFYITPLFVVTTQSGIKSMTLSLDGAREGLLGQPHTVVEC